MVYGMRVYGLRDEGSWFVELGFMVNRIRVMVDGIRVHGLRSVSSRRQHPGVACGIGIEGTRLRRHVCCSGFGVSGLVLCMERPPSL